MDGLLHGEPRGQGFLAVGRLLVHEQEADKARLGCVDEGEICFVASGFVT